MSDSEMSPVSKANEVGRVVNCRACGELVTPALINMIVARHQSHLVYGNEIYKKQTKCPNKRCGEIGI